MIHCGVKKIPEAHIMKRWTRSARHFEYPDDTCTSDGEQLGQSLLFINVLEVVRSTDKDPKAGEILMRYLNMARKEIDGLHSEKNNSICSSDGYSSAGYTSATAAEDGDQSGYDSDGKRIVRNMYGAVGSSAYMSDCDIQNIQAPMVPEQVGRRREKRFLPLFKRKRKSKKRYMASPTFCENCNQEGHICNTCNGSSSSKSKKVRMKKKSARTQ